MKTVVCILAVLTLAAGPSRATEDALNAARVDRGLTSIERSPYLHNAALTYILVLYDKGYLEHGGCYTITGYSVCGEILGGSARINRLVRDWLNSPSHRAVMLGDWDLFGAGVIRRDGVYWACVLYTR